MSKPPLKPGLFAPAAMSIHPAPAPAEPFPQGVAGTEKAYSDLVQTGSSVREYGFSIARWLMASLLAINGGGQIAVLAAIDKTSAPAAGAGPWFVIGLITAVLGGMATWLNCGAVLHGIEERVDHNRGQIASPDTPAGRFSDKVASVMTVASTVAFFLSLICFGVGAWGAGAALP